MTTFECQGCGECCKNLLITNKDGTYGMLLTQTDVTRFSPADVSPLYAVDKPMVNKAVIFWQINKKECPNYDKVKGCKIYSDRPLVCKAFPIVNSAISLTCGVADSFMRYPVERENAEKLKRHIEHRMLDVKQLYRFDLKTGQWRHA